MRSLGGYRHIIALAFILCLAAALRLYNLSTVPTELIADELDLYNSVHSIVTTGHDLDGTLQPFLYSRFTRNPPVYGVAGYLSTLAFGKSAFALRLPAVLFGLAAVFFMYGIALRLTNRRDVALVAALLQATQPIFIQFSRIAWEPSSELPFLLGGLYVLIAAFQQRRLSFVRLEVAALLLALTSYTYMAGWFYAAILGGGFVLLNAPALRSVGGRLKVAGACAIWLALSLPALRTVFFDPLTAGKTARIGTFAHGMTLSSLQTFAANYLSHFRFSYLVTTGDPQAGITWRYLNGFGAFYWFVVPLAILGVAALFSYIRQNGLRWWVWLWLLAYPLGGALTNEGAPNAPRTLAGAPVFCLLAALGFVLLADRFRKKAVPYAALALACAVSTVLFASFYFTQYIHRNSNAWDSGTRALFAEIRAQSPSYRRVCFNVRAASYDVDTYARFYLSDTQLQWFDDVGEPECSLPGTLIATDPQHRIFPPDFRALRTISDVDGSRFAFVIGRRT
jgi:4-amino-4-deoxy-L-arabinose transferase-like glycosyltransferase